MRLPVNVSRWMLFTLLINSGESMLMDNEINGRGKATAIQLITMQTLFKFSTSAIASVVNMPIVGWHF